MSELDQPIKGKTVEVSAYLVRYGEDLKIMTPGEECLEVMDKIGHIVSDSSDFVPGLKLVIEVK